MNKLLTAFVLFCSQLVYAQSNMTLYNMEPIPQRLSVNPAFVPDCKWYFGMPALSSVDAHFASNSFRMSDFNNAIQTNSRGKYTLNLTALGESMNKGAFVHFGLNQEWFNFGFRLRKSMFTASITEKIKTRIDFPTDLFKVALEGNGGGNLGQEFDFNFGFDMLHTREFAVGYSRSFIGDKLRIGSRVKYVRGLNVISTNKNDLIFSTDSNTFAYKVRADIEINASTPILDSTLGITDPTVAILGSPKNGGVGIDIGVSFDLTNRISLTASVVDLGMVKWNDYTINVNSRNPGATLGYNGVDIRSYSGDSIKGETGFKGLADTLLSVFALDTSTNSFTTSLLGEFYLGGNVRLNDRHNAGVLLYGSFYNRTLYPALTLSWNSKIRRIIALSGSYTISRDNFVNVGLGFSINLGPEQIYFVGDNLLGSVGGYQNVMNLRFGWNHTIGRRRYEKRNKRK